LSLLSFDSGGFVVLRHGDWRAVFRYPRYRFRPSHCDALHVDLWHLGRNVLRDGGSYSYNADEATRRSFAGPAAHNTIECDDRDPMPALGPFLRGEWLQAEGVGCGRDESGAPTAEAAYTDWQGVRHRRWVRVDEGGLTVRDEIGGFREKAVLRWRLRPGEWVETEDGVRCGEYALEVRADVPIRRRALVEGWESRYYFEKTALPVLEVEVGEAATMESRLTVAGAEER
jgi:hypothetical protein